MIFFVNNKKIESNGFSLMELLVVIALLGIITSMTLVNYNSFGKEVELENSAHSIALFVREIQTYGINKKTRENGHVDNPNTLINEIKDSFGADYGYGVYFNKQAPSNNEWDNKNFIFYRDYDNNKIFDQLNCSNSTHECFSKIKIGKGNRIHSIRTVSGGISNINNNDISIFFKRPYPDANIIINRVRQDYVDIKLTDTTTTYFRCVKVGAAGDVSVKKCSW